MSKTIDFTEEELTNLSWHDKLKRIMNNPPQWLFILTLLLYAYGSYWALSSMTSGTMDPKLVNGQYQTSNHSNVTYFTPAEYLIVHRQHVLYDTGFLLLFASFAFTVFFPKKDKQDSI